ncbi:MAG: TatD family hydrolase [Chloroflexota bacterium]|nr:TatD family hydrolase [Chloroflexota bacterium]
MIDTHCHLNFDAFDDDRDAVVVRAQAAGVDRIVVPAVDLPTSVAVTTLAQTQPGVYAAVGVHPNSTTNWSAEHLAAIEDYSRAPKIVAIGEIGLDYHWDYSPHAVQKIAFQAQLDLAKRLQLPVIIHNRESSEDVMAMLENWVQDLPPLLKDRPGVMHSFSGDMAIAERALAAGFYLGFTGPVTYKNAVETRRIAAAVPLERLLVETDAPYLTPIPHRGKRNEPAYIPLVVERLAAVKGISTDDMARITTENAERLFLI